MVKRSKRKAKAYALPASLSDEFIADLLSAIPDRDSFGSSYLASELLSKYNGTSEECGPDLRQSRAISKWLATEQRNRRTNARLLLETSRFRKVRSVPRVGDRRMLNSSGWVTSDRILEVARQIIAEILGPLSWTRGSFSGGASTSRKRHVASPAHKFTGEANITDLALPYWAHECFQDRGVRHITPSVICGNILFTVPKNAEIDRVACKEPDLNMYLQKGIGDHIRYRLRRFGIDLNDQTRNGQLARLGSIDGSLATVDLSSASDSVTTQLCAVLLPTDYFVVCMALRSPYTFVNGVWHENEMMSSMGNGFTFELESLIFYALARACAYVNGVKGVISVYGDDIIIPSQLFRFLKDVFGFCGFIVNPKKSFASGKFRESCGHHWYSGADVKPFYIRRPVVHVSDLIQHLNAFREWSASSCGIADPRIKQFYDKWASYVPDHLKGPRHAAINETLYQPTGRSLRLTRKAVLRTAPQDGALLAWLRLGACGVVTSTSNDVGPYIVRSPSPWYANQSWFV